MASGEANITAGLPVRKDSGQSAGGNGSAFITAGLSKVQEAAASGTTPTPYYFRKMQGAD